MVSAGKMPTTRQASTRNSTGKRIQRGGSCGCARQVVRRRARRRPMDEAQRIGHAEEAAEQRDPGRRAVEDRAVAGPRRASAKNISFDRKPFSSGTPAMAAAATMASVAVIGM